MRRATLGLRVVLGLMVLPALVPGMVPQVYGAEPNDGQSADRQAALKQFVEAVERYQQGPLTQTDLKAVLAEHIESARATAKELKTAEQKAATALSETRSKTSALKAEVAELTGKLKELQGKLAAAEKRQPQLAADSASVGKRSAEATARLTFLMNLEKGFASIGGLNKTVPIAAIAKKPAPKPAPSRPVAATTETAAARAVAILNARCFECHNEEKAKGRLVLTSRASVLEGGKHGAAIVIGKSAESLLAKALLPDADPHMPPKKQLSEKEIVELRAWINAGAVWDEALLAAKPSEPVQLGPLPASYRPVLAIALSPDQKRLAAGRGNQIFLRDLETEGRPVIGRLEGHQDAVQSLAFSPDGKLLASGGYGSVRVWNVAEQKAVHELTEVEGRVTALTFTPDNATLVTASGHAGQPATIRLWSVSDGKPIAQWTAHDDTIFDLDISADGKRLATAGADNVAKIWELASRKEIAKLEGHTAHVLAVAFKPDGTRLATGSADKDLKIWSVDGKDQTITVRGHGKAVTGVVWKTDGSQIVSSSADGLVRLSQEDKKAIVKNFTTAGEVLYGLACSGDGKTVYAGSHDGAVHVWGEDGKIQAKLAIPAEKVAAK